MSWTRARRLRQVVQVMAFALYIYLLLAALQRRTAFPLADLFFRLDPLVAVGAMVAVREWVPRLAPALVTTVLALALGRVWCGWFCPLGSLLEWTRFPLARQRSERMPVRLRVVKYLLLSAVLGATLFGSLTLMVLDPITLLTRTLTVSVLPALNHAITALERALYPLPVLDGLVDGIERLLRGTVLPVQQPVYAQNILIASLFAIIVGLNALAPRFWCRYLCPLGALLGLLSKVALLRPVVGRTCNRCGHCLGVCEVDAIDTRTGYDIVSAECTVCLDCLAACPQGGIAFQWRPGLTQASGYDASRRQLLTGLAAGAAGVALLQTGAHAKQPAAHLIRPPGVTDEDTFLSRCVRCSQCMKVCPTSGLQPTILEAGLQGIWTPQLVPRLGYCDYSCHACGQVCPSGAIPSLDLPRKREAVMGVAVVDRNRCLPWAQGIPCIVCEEMCPRPEKAVRLQEAALQDDQGEMFIVQQPYVLQDQCTGCGICEYQCPVEGRAAINVYR